MTKPTTWRECADAGMTLTEAARLLGKTLSAGSNYAKRHGFEFRKDYSAHAERMRKRHADPEFAKAHAERSAERMRKLHANPAFNPLAALSEQERADYDLLKRAGYKRSEALGAIGRADLGQHEAAE